MKLIGAKKATEFLSAWSLDVYTQEGLEHFQRLTLGSYSKWRFDDESEINFLPVLGVELECPKFLSVSYTISSVETKVLPIYWYHFANLERTRGACFVFTDISTS